MFVMMLVTNHIHETDATVNFNVIYIPIYAKVQAYL
jgi:hypothetical protein